jgi:hypothetical protein
MVVAVVKVVEVKVVLEAVVVVGPKPVQGPEFGT